MKREFGYSDGDVKLVIWSHAGIFHLRYEDSEKDIAKADDQKVLRAWIDGYGKGKSTGNKKYFDRYMNLKQFIRQQDITIPEGL